MRGVIWDWCAEEARRRVTHHRGHGGHREEEVEKSLGLSFLLDLGGWVWTKSGSRALALQ